MRAITLCAVAISGLLIAGCSSRSSRPTSSSGSVYALGDISEDRSLFFTEGEDFKDKSGGDFDLKDGASKGKCLGSRWGEGVTDYVTYAFDLKQPSESTLLVLRAALDGTIPQFYDVLIDGNAVSKAEIDPTGGYGYIDRQWKCFSVPLGHVAQGPHTLTLKPIRAGEIVNIDCLAIGKAR